MLRVDKFPYPRKQSRGNKFIPCWNNICDILKRFRSFKITAITLIWPKSLYKHSVTRSYRSGKEKGRRSESPLWRHQWRSFVFISHADDVKREIRFHISRLLTNQKRESARIMGLNYISTLRLTLTLSSSPFCFSVRLADGSSPNEGRVEIRYSGQWGTVCNDDFDNVDAMTVCWQLGYSGGIARTSHEFGEGSGPIWLDNVACDGSAAEIGACEHNGWGRHNCWHREDVGVECGKYHCREAERKTTQWFDRNTACLRTAKDLKGGQYCLCC